VHDAITQAVIDGLGTEKNGRHWKKETTLQLGSVTFSASNTVTGNGAVGPR
jgi:hypothetical protein